MPGRLTLLGAGKARSVPVYGEVVYKALTETQAGIGTLTMVQLIKAASLLATPSRASTSAIVTMRGTVQNVYIGHKAGSGNVYNFATTPVAVTFSGGTTTSGNGEVLTDSDAVAFAWNGTSDILVAFETVLNNAKQAANTAVDSHYKASVQDAATVSKTGYSQIADTQFGFEGLRLSGFAAGQGAAVRNKVVVCDGNSLVAGTGPSTTAQSFEGHLIAELRYGSRIYNLGQGGQTTTARMNANGTGPLFTAGAIAVLWEVTNELQNSVAPATAYANYVSWCQAVRAQGYKVVSMTVLPRTQSGLPASFETDRQTVNTSIRTNWASFSDALCDVGDNATLGVAGAQDNTTYYTDKVHLTSAGYAIVAGLLKPLVLAL